MTVLVLVCSTESVGSNLQVSGAELLTGEERTGEYDTGLSYREEQRDRYTQRRREDTYRQCVHREKKRGWYRQPVRTFGSYQVTCRTSTDTGSSVFSAPRQKNQPHSRNSANSFYPDRKGRPTVGLRK